ncbi:MAG: alkylmercury lyase [Pseudonocardiales bacterium]|nr:alkylmercury lyase [Pseudonocardiales bacterium]
MKVELLYAPGCPNAEPMRRQLAGCLTTLGVRAEFTERVGQFLSPTVLVNGADVLGGADIAGQRCRLNLPTDEQILTALQAAMP